MPAVRVKSGSLDPARWAIPHIFDRSVPPSVGDLLQLVPMSTSADGGAPPPRRRIPIRPQVGVFSVFEAVDYKAWFALAEFVDNSIQSRIDGVHSGRLEPNGGLRIEIEVGGGADAFIRIKDNAGGIAADRFENAFEVGSPPPDASGLSVYGIGMKSAAAWFAHKFRLRTTCPGEETGRQVYFDFAAIVRQGIEELEIDDFATERDEHWTEVLLTELKHPIQSSTHAKVRDHLTSIYRNYIRDGLVVLSYRGEELKYEDPEVLTAPFFRDSASEPVTWRKDIAFDLSTGESVRGFAAIRRTGKASGSGFSLYRRGRVITGLDDDPWRPTEIFGYGNSYRSQRLFGELHLTNVKVAYSKNGFVWQASQEELIDRLREALDADPLPLLKQAEGHRAREPENRQRQAAKNALSGTADAIGAAVQRELHERVTDDPQETASAIEMPEAQGEIEHRELEVTFAGQRWCLRIELVDDEGADWLVLGDSGAPGPDASTARRVGIRLNINTAFMRRFGGTDASDMEAILRLGGAIALAVIAAREQGVRYADYLLVHVNKLLRGNLAR